MKNLRIVYMIMFVIFAFATSTYATTITITGSSATDVLTTTNYTCTITNLPSGYTVVSYTWSASWIGSTGTINGSTSIPVTVTPCTTCTTNVAAFKWDTFHPPVDDDVTCSVILHNGTTNETQPTVSYDVHVRGIPNGIYMTGPTSIQQCCTTNVTYNVYNYGDGNNFTWSAPPGWGAPTSGGGLADNFAKYNPDNSTGGTVQCVVRISTAPSSYTRTPSVSVSRPYPVITSISYEDIPCNGTEVTFTCNASPCGAPAFTWDVPDGWTSRGQIGNTITVTVVESGYVTVTVDYAGGCQVIFPPMWIFVQQTTPSDPEFNNGCPPEDVNGHFHGDKRICAHFGGTIKIIVPNPYDAQEYFCTVTSPWVLHDGVNSGTTLTVVPANINSVVILIPSPQWYTTDRYETEGTYCVQASNCSGTSDEICYDFQREIDWFCECPSYDECTAPVWIIDEEDNPCIADFHWYSYRLASPISPSSNTDEINIFPNPGTGNFILQMPVGAKQIFITDIAGRVLMNKMTSETRMTADMEKNADGIYYLTVKTNTLVYKTKLSVIR